MSKRVYIAGPYTKGDVAANVRAAMDAADGVLAAGFIPFIPHLTHFWHLVNPRRYEFWLVYDTEWLRVCDAVLRLPDESYGADKEVELALKLGLPVFHSIAGLLAWNKV